MKHRRPSGVPMNIAKQVKPGGWVEVASGLSFGVRTIPNRWFRWWLRVLCGWTFRTIRPE